MRLDSARMTSTTALWWWLGAAAALVLWVVTAFALALPTGWVHLSLVAGVLAAVRAMVEGDRRRSPSTRPSVRSSTASPHEF